MKPSTRDSTISYDLTKLIFIYFILSFHFNKVNYFQLFVSIFSEVTAVAPNYHKVQKKMLINKLHWYQECLIALYWKKNL